MRLRHQQFTLFVYRNAVAVYSVAHFVNTTMTPVTQEFALPSTGHASGDRGDEGPVSNGILSVQMHVEHERVVPEIVHDENEDWFTIQAKSGPEKERKITAIFWAETSLEDVDATPGLDSAEIAIGKRGFLVDLCHSAVWNDVVEHVDVSVVLKGGLSFDDDAFSAEPETYDLHDSTLVWSLRNLEATPDDNILVSYTPSGPWGAAPNTMAKLSRHIVGSVYDSLRVYRKEIDE